MSTITEEKLKQVLGGTNVYLDFHSVVGGFREIGLIGLVEHPKPFNHDTGTQIPSFEKQLKAIKTYFQSTNPHYQLIPAWEHLYFIAKISRRKDIENLLIDHPIPINSERGEKRLGLLLNFPECCVDAHPKGETLIRTGFYALPFTPCSEACEKPWMQEYIRLARKYKIDITKRYINGKE